MEGIKEALDRIPKPQPGESDQPLVNMTELLKRIQKTCEILRSGRSTLANHKLRIPVRYHGKTILKDKQHQDGLRALQGGQSLYLTGKPGSGKTHLAIALMGEWFADNFKAVEGQGAPSKGYPLFIPAVELLLEIKASWSDRDDHRTESEKEILDKYSRVPLLVIDDLGAEKISEWSRQVLYLLIDRRYRDMKQTIITSNLTQGELAEQLDDRVASRISEMGIVLDLGSKDHRVCSGVGA